MISLLIIADDLTGALDTGIQFARYKTKILTKTEFSDSIFNEPDTDILVVDTESRHLPPEKAYQIVYDLTKKAVEAGVKYIYKKTDSGLRGNIGNELAAVLKASQEKFIAFIPALPLMNRVTIQGIQYIDGLPVHKSVFGQDPYAPVKSSYVKDLFHMISYPTVLFEDNNTYATDFTEPTIGIFDAQSAEDLINIGKHLKENNQLKVIAGCTGFAAVLPELIGKGKSVTGEQELNKSLLVVCGSLNPISKQQIEYGEEMGIVRTVLSPEQLFEKDYFTMEAGERWLSNLKKKLIEQRVVMIDSGISQPDIMTEYINKKGYDTDEVRVKILRTLGNLLAQFYHMQFGYETTVMIIGGDTLRGFIETVDCDEINLMCEITMGTVLSKVKVLGDYAQIISKSGGFGRRELLVDIANRVLANNKYVDQNATNVDDSRARVLCGCNEGDRG